MADPSKRSRAILIINPNTTQIMTEGLKPLIDSLGFNDILFEYFTAPAGVSSINDEDDAAISAKACLPVLLSKINDFDAFLVCCYSHHPLVSQLRAEIDKTDRFKPVTGIFEASVATCLQGLDFTSSFGIVSTGAQWEEILGEAVASMLGSGASSRYAGTATTGLNAEELHTATEDDMRSRMTRATQSLLDKGVSAICLGCAGMAGMDKLVSQACIDHYGPEKGRKIKIVDGVVSGVLFLESALRAGS